MTIKIDSTPINLFKGSSIIPTNLLEYTKPAQIFSSKDIGKVNKNLKKLNYSRLLQNIHRL